MTLPTVTVTCAASDQNGNPVAGAKFEARLDRTETYQGFVVPEKVDGIADEAGVCLLQLWPNALGVAGSSYLVRATNPDTGKRFLNTNAVVPNSACNLHEILVQEPYPPIDAAQQALIAAQAALAPVTEQAAIATAAAEAAEADRLQADLDAQATAADRLQTGLDRQATAADRIATGQDRLQTGQDRTSTGADRLQTGLDRAQTGLDRTAAEQAAIDAQAAAAEAQNIVAGGVNIDGGHPDSIYGGLISIDAGTP